MKPTKDNRLTYAITAAAVLGLITFLAQAVIANT